MESPKLFTASFDYSPTRTPSFSKVVPRTASQPLTSTRHSPARLPQPAKKNLRSGNNSGGAADWPEKSCRLFRRRPIPDGGSSLSSSASRVPSASALSVITTVCTNASMRPGWSGLARRDVLRRKRLPELLKGVPSAAACCSTTLYTAGRRMPWLWCLIWNANRRPDCLTAPLLDARRCSTICSWCAAHVCSQPAHRRRLEQDAQHHSASQA